MSKFIQARQNVVINMDHVCSVIHDPSGFESTSGHMKSIRIGLLNDNAVTIHEGDPQYQVWLDFMSEAGSLIDEMPSRQVPDPKQWRQPDVSPIHLKRGGVVYAEVNGKSFDGDRGSVFAEGREIKVCRIGKTWHESE